MLMSILFWLGLRMLLGVRLYVDAGISVAYLEFALQRDKFGKPDIYLEGKL